MKNVLKKTFSRFFLVISALFTIVTGGLLTSCNEPDMPFLILGDEAVVLGSEMAKMTIDVKSNLAWEAKTTSDWVRIAHGTGKNKGQFEIIVDTNEGSEERFADVVVSGGVCNATLLVRQTSRGTILSVSTDTIRFTKNADQFTVTVGCNDEWEVESSSSWCSVSVSKGKYAGRFTIAVEENTTGSDRTAIVTVVTEAGGVYALKEIVVFQSASNVALAVYPTEKILTEAEETFSISVYTTGNWTANTDSDWLKIAPKTGNRDANIQVVAEANTTGLARKATISICTGEENENREVREVTVTQIAGDFYLVMPITDFAVGRDGVEIPVKYLVAGSNVTVEGATSADWLRFRSIEDGTALLAVEPNNSSESREATISLSTTGQRGEPIVCQARVAQTCTVNILDVLTDEVILAYDGETVRLPVYANTEITARSSSSWCTATVEGHDIVISAPANNTGRERVAYVTVTTKSDSGKIISKVIKVIQGAGESDLMLVPSEKLICAGETQFVATVVTNGTWTATVDESWVSLDKVKGTRDGMITVKVAENKSGQERKATIAVSSGPENKVRQTKTIELTQIAEYFYFEVPIKFYPVTKNETNIDLNYLASGSVVEIVESTNVSWIIVNSVADGVASLTVKENRTGERREGVLKLSAIGQYGDPVTREVKFVQSPTVNILDILVDEYEFTGKSGMVELPIVTNDELSVKTSASWITATYADGTVTIAVEKNTSASIREGYVTLETTSPKGDKLTKKIVIRQLPLNATLVVNPASIEFLASKDTLSLSIASTGNWTAATDVKWFTIDKTAGEGDATIVVAATQNTTGLDRKGTITITTT
ncbi:MAG: BACON domain-containing protein, partial [Bacteroidales bacterium]|nr:BACON domain-containing protein [Bacteroidales bacterium]